MMFDTGLLTICELVEVSEDGLMPVQRLEQKSRVYYGDRTITATRLYQARGADCEIDKLVRVPFDTDAQPNDYVVLENGDQFRVDAASPVIVKRDTRALELTLIKLGENYDVKPSE